MLVLATLSGCAVKVHGISPVGYSGPQPSLITMHFRNAPLMDVLEDFSRQANAEMGIHEATVTDYARNRRITIDLDHVSFWVALARIGQLAELYPEDEIGGEFRLSPDGAGLDPSDPSFVVDGPFAFWRSFGAINVIPEPKLQALQRLGFDWIKLCVDEKGRSLDTKDERLGRHMVFSNKWGSQNIHSDTSRIAVMKGEIDCDIEVAGETIRVTDFSTASSIVRHIGVYTMSIDHITRIGNVWQVQLIVSTDPGSDIQRQVPMYADNDFDLLDAHGIPLRGISVAYGDNPQRWTITTDWTPGSGPEGIAGEAHEFRWHLPTQIEHFKFPFEIHDMPLPQHY
jgi:hypothetical protein